MVGGKRKGVTNTDIVTPFASSRFGMQNFEIHTLVLSDEQKAGAAENR
jgi:hypothetical protein